jgi:hypothetical protein
MTRQANVNCSVPFARLLADQKPFKHILTGLETYGKSTLVNSSAYSRIRSINGKQLLMDLDTKDNVHLAITVGYLSQLVV